MKNYDWITNEMFDKKLLQIMKRSPHDIILAIPGIHEVLREHYNNDVIEELETERKDKKDWFFSVISEKGSGAQCVMSQEQTIEMFGLDAMGDEAFLMTHRGKLAKAIEEPENDSYLINAVLMSQAEVDNLPEFEGW